MNMATPQNHNTAIATATAEHEAADRLVLEAIARGAPDAELERLKRAREAAETRLDGLALAPYVARALAALSGGGRLTQQHREGFAAALAAGFVTGPMARASLTAAGREAIEARDRELHGGTEANQGSKNRTSG